MSLAAVGSGQHFNLGGDVPPPGGDLALQFIDTSNFSWVPFLLGVGAWAQMLRLG